MKKIISLLLVLQTLIAPVAVNLVQASVSNPDRQLFTYYNLITNGGYENNQASWTIANGTASADTSNFIEGTESGKVTLSAQQGSATNVVTPTQSIANTYMEASCAVSTSLSNVEVCAVVNGVEVGCTNPVLNDGFWHGAQGVVFAGPAAGVSVGVRVKTTSSSTGSFNYDACYVGQARNVFQSSTGIVSAGSIFPTAATSCPAGSLATNGAAVSRATNTALFAAVGTTYGAGDGSTTFNLPNTMGVFLRGAGSQTVAGRTHTGTQGPAVADTTALNGVHDTGHNHTAPYASSPDGPTAQNWATAPYTSNVATNVGYSGGVPVSTSTANLVGDNETAPANISVQYCIQTTNIQDLLYQASSGGLNPGEESITAAQACPMGTIPEDGSSYPVAQYPALYAAIGIAYGGSAGVSFNVPNAMGVFERGAGSQTVAGKVHTGTQGATLGDTTAVNGLNDGGGHSHPYISPYVPGSGFYFNEYEAGGGTAGNATSYNTGTTHITLAGDPETAPASISHLHCIRYIPATPAPVVLPVVNPPGSLLTTIAPTCPTGTLAANGGSYSTTLYPNLFAAIGYTYGGSGTSFNIANAQGIFLRGAGSQTVNGVVHTGTRGPAVGDTTAVNGLHDTGHTHNSPYQAGQFFSGSNGNFLFNGGVLPPAGTTTVETGFANLAGDTETAPASVAVNYCVWY